MRTCNPEAIRAAIIMFDEGIDDSLQHIFGVPVRGLDRLTIHLPLSLGGIGIPIAALSVDHAFLSSVGATWHLQPNLSPRHGFLDACNREAANGTIIPQLSNKNVNPVAPLINQTKVLGLGS
jgi:hypothetical protein